MNKPTIGLIGLVGLVALLYATCTSVITQGESAVLLNFGKPIKVIREPGLYFRFPYPFNSLEIIDNRLLLLQPRPSEFLTADKKNLILENAICYRIIDPILFMKTVRDQSGLLIPFPHPEYTTVSLPPLKKRSNCISAKYSGWQFMTKRPSAGSPHSTNWQGNITETHPSLSIRNTWKLYERLPKKRPSASTQSLYKRYST